MAHIPERTCIGCGLKKSKKDFIKLTKNKRNEINIDKFGNNEGRGAYICDNMECFNKAFKYKKIEKTFKMNVDQEVYERLKGIISDK